MLATLFYIFQWFLFFVMLALLGVLRKRITKGENPFPEKDGSYRIF